MVHTLVIPPRDIHLLFKACATVRPRLVPNLSRRHSRVNLRDNFQVAARTLPDIYGARSRKIRRAARRT